ncbi:MAG: hypothetical protein HFH91_19050 [Lachnospiraceae bacterium]|nr:hypothetical protein [Lachnospiraceae bacterium]
MNEQPEVPEKRLTEEKDDTTVGFPCLEETGKRYAGAMCDGAEMISGRRK